MPYINLIQEQRAAAHKNEVLSRTSFFAFVSIAVISVATYGSLLFKADSLKSDEAKLQHQLQKLEPLVAQIKKNEQEESELKPRLDSLVEAKALTDKWISVMQHLAVQTPQNTWLTGIRSIGQDAEKPVAITLVGMSSAQQPIGEFMLRTQNEPNLENVMLKFTNEKPTIVGTSIEFEIGAELKDSATKKIKSEENAS